MILHHVLEVCTTTRRVSIYVLSMHSMYSVCVFMYHDTSLLLYYQEYYSSSMSTYQLVMWHGIDPSVYLIRGVLDYQRVCSDDSIATTRELEISKLTLYGGVLIFQQLVVCIVYNIYICVCVRACGMHICLRLHIIHTYIMHVAGIYCMHR